MIKGKLGAKGVNGRDPSAMNIIESDIFVDLLKNLHLLIL